MSGLARSSYGWWVAATNNVFNCLLLGARTLEPTALSHGVYEFKLEGVSQWHVHNTRLLALRQCIVSVLEAPSEI